MAATACRDSRSRGSGSISDSRFAMAIHRSGTDGLDVTRHRPPGIEEDGLPALIVSS